MNAKQNFDTLSLNDAMARLLTITTKDAKDENDATESQLDFAVALDDDNHPVLGLCFPGCAAVPSQVSMSSSCMSIKMSATMFLSELRVSVKSIEQNQTLCTLYPMAMKGAVKWSIDKDGVHILRFSVAGKVPSNVVSSLMTCIEETLSISVNEMQLNLFEGKTDDDEQKSA